jgi:hypothetical protein
MSKSDYLKLALETSGFLGSLITFFRTKSRLKEIDKLLFFIARAYQFTPSTFLDVLHENSKFLLGENLLNIRESEHQFQATGFLRGYADTARPIRSVLRKDKALVANRLKSLPIYSNSQSIDGRDYIVKYNHADTFLLKDPRSLSSAVVVNPKESPNQLAFSKIAEKSEFRSFNWAEMLITKAIWLIQLCLGILKIYPSFKGFLMGVKTTEHGIEIGQSVLAFGQITFNKLTKSLSMEAPSFLLSEKGQITSFYSQERNKFQRVRNFSLLLSVVFGLLVLRRAILVGKNISERIGLFLEKIKMKKFQKYSEALSDDYKCIICIENPKNVIFKPCLHMSMCKNCYASLPKQECPICKRPIKSLVTLFLV